MIYWIVTNMTQIGMVILCLSVIGLCWCWYLGTDRFLVNYETRRRLRLRKKVMNSPALRNHAYRT